MPSILADFHQVADLFGLDDEQQARDAQSRLSRILEAYREVLAADPSART